MSPGGNKKNPHAGSGGFYARRILCATLRKTRWPLDVSAGTLTASICRSNIDGIKTCSRWVSPRVTAAPPAILARWGFLLVRWLDIEIGTRRTDSSPAVSTAALEA